MASAALTHHGKGPVKGEPLTLNQVVSTANRIANMNKFAHPVTTAFEDPPEEGFLDVLEIKKMQIVQENLTKITLNLVVTPEYNKNIEEKATFEVRNFLGEHVDISIKLLPDIPNNPVSGKFQEVICKITPDSIF